MNEIREQSEIHEKLLALEGGQVRVDRWRAEEGGSDVSVVGKLDHDDEYADDEHDDCSFIVALDTDTYAIFKIGHVQELSESPGVGWVVVL